MGRIRENRDMVSCVKIWSRLFSGRHGTIWLAIFSYFKKLRDNLNMHFKDDPISDMHAKNYLIISCLKHFPGPTKFGPVFWSRLFRRGPVEYNYPLYQSGSVSRYHIISGDSRYSSIFIPWLGKAVRMVHDTLMNDTLSTMTLRWKFLSNTISLKSDIVEYDT